MVYIWVILYGLTYELSDLISKAMHLKVDCKAPAMMIYLILLVFWLYKTEQNREIGLCLLHSNSIKLIITKYSISPLFLLAVINLCFSGNRFITLSDFGLALSVSVTEEIFFRGYLLHFFAKKKKVTGIVISSVLFALPHFVNLTHCDDLVYILIQVLCAFSVGLCFAAITIDCGSILPGCAAHFATNLTGMHAVPTFSDFVEPCVLLLCIGVYLCYGISLIYKIQINSKENQ